jgi:hypothetical protein
MAVQIQRNKMASCWLPVSRTGPISPWVPTVGAGGKVHLHTFLTSDWMQVTCWLHASGVYCCGVSSRKEDWCPPEPGWTLCRRDTLLLIITKMCFPHHPSQNTITWYNLHLTKSLNPGVSHLSKIVNCKNIQNTCQAAVPTTEKFCLERLSVWHDKVFVCQCDMTRCSFMQLKNVYWQ